VTRQTGIYHRFNTVTLQNLYILFHPNTKSVADKAAQDVLMHHHDKIPEKGLFWLHDVLLSTYLPGWRRYIVAREEELLPIVSIDTPLLREADTRLTL
jgi:hypothetical protein